MGRSFELQQALAYGPTVVDAADDIGSARQRILEQGFVERRRAGDQSDGTYLNPRLVHVDEHQADAFMFRLLDIGTHEHENVVAIHGIGRPSLTSVDDVLIAVEFGTRTQTRKIGAGAGF